MLFRSVNTKFVCQEYLEKLKRENKKQTTRATYQNKIENYILPYIPKVMKSINSSDCQNLVNILLEKKLSNKTINDTVTLLNSILFFAFEKKYKKELIKIKKIKEDKTDTELFGDKHTFYISIDPSDVLRRHMTGHIPEFGKFFHKYHQQIDQNTYDRQKDHRPFGTVGIRLSTQSKMGGNLIRQMIPAQNKT